MKPGNSVEDKTLATGKIGGGNRDDSGEPAACDG